MALKLLLHAIGILLFCASRMSSRLRQQITRDLVISVGSKDGVARSYVFKDRRISSRHGLTTHASCTVLFANAALGFRIFASRNAIERIVDGLACHEIELKGDATHVLWFYEMTMALLPWIRPVSTVMPAPYLKPDPTGKVADRVTREPVAQELDPTWTGAVAAREKQMMWQVGEGATVPGRPKDFKFVIDDRDSSATQDESIAGVSAGSLGGAS